MRLLMLITTAMLLVSSPSMESRSLGRGTQLPQADRMSLDLQVDLPLTPQGWSKALGILASREHRVVGLELLPGVPEVFPRDQPGTMLALSGLSLLQAARLLAQHDTRYAVQQDTNGVLSVRPLVSINSRDDFLNRVLPHFELKDQPLVTALDAIHQQLDPAYRATPRHLERLDALDRNFPGRAARVRAALSKPITLSLDNRTVRDILNAVAIADGEMWWSVAYDKTSGAYHESRITFVGYDNWAIGAKARRGTPRPQRRGE
jgi:hypothetical protein